MVVVVVVELVWDSGGMEMASNVLCLHEFSIDQLRQTRVSPMAQARSGQPDGSI